MAKTAAPNRRDPVAGRIRFLIERRRERRGDDIGVSYAENAEGVERNLPCGRDLRFRSVRSCGEICDPAAADFYVYSVNSRLKSPFWPLRPLSPIHLPRATEKEFSLARGSLLRIDGLSLGSRSPLFREPSLRRC